MVNIARMTLSSFLMRALWFLLSEWRCREMIQERKRVRGKKIGRLSLSLRRLGKLTMFLTCALARSSCSMWRRWRSTRTIPSTTRSTWQRRKSMSSYPFARLSVLTAMQLRTHRPGLGFVTYFRKKKFSKKENPRTSTFPWPARSSVTTSQMKGSFTNHRLTLDAKVGMTTISLTGYIL